ncbi:gag protease polyprotein [Cucumis melo var. makuwa]|uniref:Gag protease polyprotein n=1 Tax=Cucumis melo var. makuwa TaxID=1194695 RepID=A0A5D3DRS0_CUCMM|nr:gag protease polyprotein [Cucumis melo var. makuwa]TYK26326.1 gag protease polyprotein [Cucumis melo var. makuwa]
MKCLNDQKITWKQFKESFYAKFFSVSLRYAKQQQFLNQEHDNMAVEQYKVVRNKDARTGKFVIVDMSLHKRADSFKAARRWLTPEIAVARKTLRELPVCHGCGRSHGGRYLAGSGVFYKCKQLRTTSNQTSIFQYYGDRYHHSSRGRASQYYGDRYTPNLGALRICVV